MKAFELYTESLYLMCSYNAVNSLN